MSYSFAQAVKIAIQRVSSMDAVDGGVSIVQEDTKEFDAGWVFYYQSTRFLETGNQSYLLAGNAPLFVARSDGKATFVSYHRPLNESMAAYRACGNPNAREIPKVQLTGWHPGALSVTAIQVVRQHSAIGLGEAKRVVDGCLANEKPVVSTPDVASARALVQSLASAGFVGELQYDG